VQLRDVRRLDLLLDSLCPAVGLGDADRLGLGGLVLDVVGRRSRTVGLACADPQRDRQVGRTGLGVAVTAEPLIELTLPSPRIRARTVPASAAYETPLVAIPSPKTTTMAPDRVSVFQVVLVEQVIAFVQV